LLSLLRWSAALLAVLPRNLANALDAQASEARPIAALPHEARCLARFALSQWRWSHASPNVGNPPPAEVFALTRDREEALSRLLIAFVSTGLFFMLFPGTFLGVWNLLQISGRESIASVSPAWLQAHGHAQVFGWVGSFILGIGFYSIPKLRDGAQTSFVAAWICWTMWTVGAATRWAANVYLWHWRTLLPFSAVLELAAFLIFFKAVSGHRKEGSSEKRFAPWIWVVISASVGLLSVLVSNLAGCIYVSARGTTPAFPHVFDQRFLVLMAWGFLVPFVWGFSAKWMSVFLGLPPIRTNWLLSAVAVNILGIVFGLCGYLSTGSLFFVAGASLAVAALRMFEPAVNQPKTRGIHSSFPSLSAWPTCGCLSRQVLVLQRVGGTRPVVYGARPVTR
jgi:uncharacterized protein involved in response to NO